MTSSKRPVMVCQLHGQEHKAPPSSSACSVSFCSASVAPLPLSNVSTRRDVTISVSPKQTTTRGFAACVLREKKLYIVPPHHHHHHHGLPPEVSELQLIVRLEAEHAHKHAGGPAAGSLRVKCNRRRGLFFFFFKCSTSALQTDVGRGNIGPFWFRIKFGSPPFPCPIVKTTQSVFTGVGWGVVVQR